MFRVNDVVCLSFSKTDECFKEILKVVFQGIETNLIPFFWDLVGNVIIINADNALCDLSKELIERITSCSDLDNEMLEDIAALRENESIRDIESVINSIRLIYEVERMRRLYITKAIAMQGKRG